MLTGNKSGVLTDIPMGALTCSIVFVQSFFHKIIIYIVFPPVTSKERHYMYFVVLASQHKLCVKLSGLALFCHNPQTGETYRSILGFLMFVHLCKKL